jgi:hypothetical protein
VITQHHKNVLTLLPRVLAEDALVTPSQVLLQTEWQRAVVSFDESLYDAKHVEWCNVKVVE